jgi:hypothetical protein
MDVVYDGHSDKGQEQDAVFVFAGQAACCNQLQIVDDLLSSKTARNFQQPGHRQALGYALGGESLHRADVVRQQETPFSACEGEDVGIGHANAEAVDRPDDVEGRMPEEQLRHDRLIEVFIGEE